MGLDRASRAGPDATDAPYIVVVVVLFSGLLRGFLLQRVLLLDLLLTVR